MSLYQNLEHQDWEGIVQERMRGWEAEVRRRQIQAQIPRSRPRWRRRAGAWLMRAGVWLTRLGAHMADHDQPQRAPVIG